MNGQAIEPARRPAHPEILWGLGSACAIAFVSYGPAQFLLVFVLRIILGKGSAQAGSAVIVGAGWLASTLVIGVVLLTIGQMITTGRWRWLVSLVMPLPLNALIVAINDHFRDPQLDAMMQRYPWLAWGTFLNYLPLLVSMIVLFAYALIGPRRPEPPQWPIM
jgi:hypothetical protein